MALLDSKFLVEIAIEDMKCYVSSKDLSIDCQFSKIFKATLKNPNDSRKISKTHKNNNRKVIGKNKESEKSKSLICKPRSEQSVTFENNTHSLIYAMRNHCIELFLWSKEAPEVKIGSASIPWNQDCVDYITNLVIRSPRNSPTLSGEFSLYDSSTKCIAKVKLTIKLSCIKFNNIVEHMKAVVEKLKQSSDGKLNLTKSDVNTNASALDDYIYGAKMGPFANQVYCVNYFTVESDPSVNATASSSVNITEITDEHNTELRKSKSETSKSSIKYQLPSKIEEITNTRCTNVKCSQREHRQVPIKLNENIHIDVSGASKTCKIKKVKGVGGFMEAKMSYGGKDSKDSCFCTCECTFGFVKKTTYCSTCGGYESPGEDFETKPFPCPIFHNLVDKSKLKTQSTSGSDIKKKGSDSQKTIRSAKSADSRKKDETPVGFESQTDNKKERRKKKDERFKFNYGYTAPHIGHSQCGVGCGAYAGAVPKKMGWLWTAGDVPGLKLRPNWKPGATNKHVVRLLRNARNPGEVISKKRKKDTGKKKRPLKRPYLIVHKKDGEYHVTMETMKQYAKPRTLNQPPYEDKPEITYTIGRTEEENRDRTKKKERKQRRLERDQRNFIQSTFKNMCQEICMETYRQALGLWPGAEDPKCPCYPAEPDPNKVDMDLSCSCSEDNLSLESDTDSDEWIVEFTPPNAKFDQTYKSKKVLTTDSETQYNYLDFRVKLLDFSGNQVPRFFRDPDGQLQCSDLGVFKDSLGNWLEINVDGFIAPDGKWVPNTFFGPNGEQAECQKGKFQAMNGNWLVVGVDGYVDSQLKWKYYGRPKPPPPMKDKPVTDKMTGTGAGDRKHDPYNKKSETTWSCFGEASPKELGRMGIFGHGSDRKRLLESLKALQARGDLDNIKLPNSLTVPHKYKRKQHSVTIDKVFTERTKCRHPTPSTKGILATDALGNKKYFRLNNFSNERPQKRIKDLHRQGKDVSNFHVPCYDSFIDGPTMKQQLYEKLLARTHVCAETQTK